jgi:putative heme-binding domain-containing protein
MEALLTRAAEGSAAYKADVLAGMREAFTGWRKAAKPAAWEKFSASVAPAATAEQSALLDMSALFGDGRALDEVKRIALDPKAELPARQAALQTLIESKPADLRAICEQLLETRFLNKTAVRGLSLFDDPELGTRLVKNYRKFWAPERTALIEVLVTRPTWARALLAGIQSGEVPKTDLSAFHARQLRTLNDPELTTKLTELWGDLRESSAEKRDLITRLKSQLTPDILAKADVSQGRAAFNMACASCHTLYGEGGKLGPDLTGSGRSNLDYLLENIVDPSAVVAADFRFSTITLNDGRVLTGMIGAKNDRTITLRTLTETLPVERTAIAKIEENPQSLMPDGLLMAFSPEQVRDLMAYLMSPQQAPLPAAK